MGERAAQCGDEVLNEGGGGVAMAATLTKINLARIKQKHYLRG